MANALRRPSVSLPPRGLGIKYGHPTKTEIEDLVGQLRVVSGRIKQDQRFAAALAIDVALAGQIQGQLNKA